jgi:hypothetical protein
LIDWVLSNPTQTVNYLAVGVVAAIAAFLDFFLWLFFLAFIGAAAGAAAAGAVVVVWAKTKLEVEATNNATKAIANNFFMIILLLIWADQKLTLSYLTHWTAGRFKKLQLR